jgi:hypothetical protein
MCNVKKQDLTPSLDCSFLGENRSFTSFIHILLDSIVFATVFKI